MRPFFARRLSLTCSGREDLAGQLRGVERNLDTYQKAPKVRHIISDCIATLKNVTRPLGAGYLGTS